MMRFLALLMSVGICNLFAGEPARPAISNGHYAFIDTAGNIVIETSLPSASNFPFFYAPRRYGFNEGRAVVRYEKGYGVVDRRGNIVFNSHNKVLKESPDALKALYYCNWIGPFSEGRAPVLLQRRFLGIDYGGGYGFMDSLGQMVIPPHFEAVGSFSEGLAPVKRNGRYGFIDRLGLVQIPFQYELARSFSDSLALVKLNGQFLYIDHLNQVVLKIKHPYPHSFKEGLAVFREGDLYGYLNTRGFVVVPAMFEAAGDFSEGLALVRYKGKYGFIDPRGQWVIPPQFKGAAGFTEGLAAVKIDSLWGYIDVSGAPAINAQFDRVWPFMNGLAIVWQNETIYYMNTSGQRVYVLFEGKLVSSAAEKEDARIQYILSH